jgi:hypothetical protein
LDIGHVLYNSRSRGEKGYLRAQSMARPDIPTASAKKLHPWTDSSFVRGSRGVVYLVYLVFENGQRDTGRAGDEVREVEAQLAALETCDSCSWTTLSVVAAAAAAPTLQALQAENTWQRVDLKTRQSHE